jgi:hypothetical protein
MNEFILAFRVDSVAEHEWDILQVRVLHTSEGHV